MGDTEAIDLTMSPPVASKPSVGTNAEKGTSAAAIDLTNDARDVPAVAVDLHSHTRPGTAMPSNGHHSCCASHAGAAPMTQVTELTPAQVDTTTEQAAEVSKAPKGKGKRKRASPSNAEQLRQKKQQAKDEKEAREAAEKRMDARGKTVCYSSRPSIKTKERIQRALPNSGHRLFLLDRSMTAPMTSENGPQEEFTVLGATANVYKVTVAKHPCCTCPDFQKGNICKHYLFVMLRVLRLRRNDPLVWQKALLSFEAEQVLGGTRSSRSDAEVLADRSVLDQYKRMTGSDVASTSSAAAGPDGAASKQRPIEGECAICYDTLEAGNADADSITFCQDCGNNLHVECFQRWAGSKKSSGAPVTCVYCRCLWRDAGESASAAKAEEYVNLRDASREHQRADTSLEALYGDTAVWIHANNGRMGRRQAASLYRLSQAG